MQTFQKDILEMYAHIMHLGLGSVDKWAVMKLANFLTLIWQCFDFWRFQIQK